MCFSCLNEVKKDVGFNKDTFTVLKNPLPVRITGKLADEDKHRRFVKIAEAMTQSVPPRPVTILGSKGNSVFVVSPADVIPLSC